MAHLVPRSIALGREKKYLEYVLENGELHSRMQLSSNRVVSEGSFTKLEVMSTQSSFEEVHIKSGYNNKFLRLSSEAENWIVAAADEPEEDRSIWSCTLFRLSGNLNRLKLFLQSGGAEHGVQLDAKDRCLVIARNSASTTDFSVTDLASLAILPKYVVFKGDNNQYLAARHILSHKRLRFNMDEPFDQRAHHEVVTLPDGNVRLRSLTYNRFWRKAGNDFIWCESNDQTANNPDTVFQPLRLDSTGNSIALKNLGNNKYCERNTTRGPRRLKGTLRASTNHVNPRAVLQVEEAVREREIYDVQYNIEDARTYNVALVKSIAANASNSSQTSTVEKFLGFTYTKMNRKTFTSSQSWKVSLSVNLKAQIPIFKKGTIQLDTMYEGSVEWTKTEEITEEIKTSIKVPVPPMTKVMIVLNIGRGSIDVPFSYTQRDILLNGKIITKRMHDGLFSGVSADMIDYDIDMEKLSEEEARAAAIPSKL